MRLARFTFELSQKYPPSVAGFLAMAATMIQPSTAFGKDGSRWHDYEDIKKRFEGQFEKVDV